MVKYRVRVRVRVVLTRNFRVRVRVVLTRNFRVRVRVRVCAFEIVSCSKGKFH